MSFVPGFLDTLGIEPKDEINGKQILCKEIRRLCHSELDSESGNFEKQTTTQNKITIKDGCGQILNISNTCRLQKFTFPDDVKTQGNSRNAAFTLAEVLITLGIIGIVAAITLPTLINSYQKHVLKNQFKTAYATLQNALYKAQTSLDHDVICGYWDKNPYGSAKCVEYTAEGNCKRHELPDGSPLPSDYNGVFTDCPKLATEMIKNLKVIKQCKGNAYRDGCIPAYKGNDTVRKAQNDQLTDYEIAQATSGCQGFREQSIRNSSQAYVLANNMIIFSYGTSFTAQIFALDVNGRRGPNKWGYDIFGFSTRRNAKLNTTFLNNGGCDIVETGGVNTRNMIINSNK